MTDTASTDDALATANAALAKLKRRQGRNERAAFAKGLMQGICSLLKPGDIVLDCGANVGAVTVPLAATGATVHAFEPDPFAFGKLQKATQDFPNVVLHNAAVGVEKGTVHLMRADSFDDNPRGASVRSTVVKGGRRIEETGQNTVEVTQLSLFEVIQNLMQENDEIAFVKMDIEGAELEILEAMHQRGSFDKIRLTVAETHEKKFKELRPRFAQLRQDVSAHYPPTQVNLDWI